MKRQGILCFLKDGDQVLLGKFDYGNGTMVWNGISGFIEDDESPDDAVLREVREEIGIEVEKSSLIYKGTHDVSNELDLKIFVSTKWRGTPKAQEEGIKELEWFSIKNLPFEHMFPGNEEWVLKFLITEPETLGEV